MGKYRVSEFAEKVGASASLLRKMDNDGRFPAKRSITDQRYYTDEDVATFLRLPLQEQAGRIVVYCRVSSHAQKPELRNQHTAMESFCLGAGLPVDEWVDEIGGGMNFNRPKFTKLILELSRGEISTLVVAHKDRLARFGFDLLQNLATANNATILVANQESLSPQEEMVQDLLSIVHTFSCRLYGLRRYKKELKEADLMGGDDAQGA